MKMNYSNSLKTALECDPVNVRIQYDMKPVDLDPATFGITRAHVAEFVPLSPKYEYRYVK